MPKPTTPAHAKFECLADRPKYLRASARGLAAARADQVRIDRGGGTFGAGLIRGVSLCTAGEALGHGMWLDGEFIDSVTEAAAASPKGVKARFTHPSLSSDGLGSFLGRILDCRTIGAKTVGDLHFSQAAHRTPDGDLATYVMDLAEGDPEAFATSIVFEADYAAEQELLLANGAEWKDGEGGPYISLAAFVSPDPANANNLPHARLAALRGCDMVDEPAANPDGLFHREQQFAQEADGVLGYALGLADEPPVCVAFGERLAVHPDRIKSFVSRFLDAHGLQVTQKPQETPMTESTPQASDASRLNATGSPDEAKPDDEKKKKPDEQESTDGSPDEAKPDDDEKKPDEQESTDGSQEEAKPDDDETKPGDQEPTDGPGAPGDGAKPDDDDSGDDDEKKKPKLSAGQVECGRFIAAFGDQGGQWYAEGLSFEAAQRRHAEALAAENAELRKRLAAAGEGLGEAEPLEFQPDGKDAGGSGSGNGKTQFKDIIRIGGKSPRRA